MLRSYLREMHSFIMGCEGVFSCYSFYCFYWKFGFACKNYCIHKCDFDKDAMVYISCGRNV